MGHFIFIEDSRDIQERIYKEEGDGFYLKSIQELKSGNFLMIFEKNTDFITLPIHAKSLKDLDEQLLEIGNERCLNVFKADGTIYRYKDLKIIRANHMGIEALLILECNSFA